ncbi:hypothetical protein [Aureivirga marina]|uniref:hypothetical protein n=1 Tax=Aureivirga marina TaxID=1182451 RepID=UPI0018CB67F7|nr:hypothetical protein [Aureivirga marina]
MKIKCNPIVLFFFLNIFFSCTNDEIDTNLIDPVRPYPAIDITGINEPTEIQTLATISQWMARPQDITDAHLYYENKKLDIQGNWKMVWYANELKSEKEIGAIISKHKINRNTFNISPSSKKIANSINELLSISTWNDFSLPNNHKNALENILSLEAVNYLSAKKETIIDVLANYIKKDPSLHLPIKIYVSGISNSGNLSLYLSTAIYQELNTQLQDVKLLPNDVRIECFTYNPINFTSSNFVNYFNSLPEKQGNQQEFITIDFTNFSNNSDVLSNFSLSENFISSFSYPMSNNLQNQIQNEFQSIALNSEITGIFNNIRGNHQVISENKLNKNSYHVPTTISTLEEFKSYLLWKHDTKNILITNNGICIPVNPRKHIDCPNPEDIFVPLKNPIIDSYLQLIFNMQTEN